LPLYRRLQRRIQPPLITLSFTNATPSTGQGRHVLSTRPLSPVSALPRAPLANLAEESCLQRSIRFVISILRFTLLLLRLSLQFCRTPILAHQYPRRFPAAATTCFAPLSSFASFSARSVVVCRGGGSVGGGGGGA